MAKKDCRARDAGQRCRMTNARCIFLPLSARSVCRNHGLSSREPSERSHPILEIPVNPALTNHGPAAWKPPDRSLKEDTTGGSIRLENYSDALHPDSEKSVMFLHSAETRAAFHPVVSGRARSDR